MCSKLESSELSHDGRIYFFESSVLPRWTINIDYLANIFENHITDDEWAWWKSFPTAYQRIREADAEVIVKYSFRMIELLHVHSTGSICGNTAFLNERELAFLVPDWIDALRIIHAAALGKKVCYWIAGGESERELLAQFVREKIKPRTSVTGL